MSNLKIVTATRPQLYIGALDLSQYVDSCYANQVSLYPIPQAIKKDLHGTIFLIEGQTVLLGDYRFQIYGVDKEVAYGICRVIILFRRNSGEKPIRLMCERGFWRIKDWRPIWEVEWGKP